MTRHPFRWEAALFGLIFTAVVVQWALRRSGLVTPEELPYVAAGALILLGLMGLVGGLARPRRGIAVGPDQDKEVAHVDADTDAQP